jgi:hypothetical protein
MSLPPSSNLHRRPVAWALAALLLALAWAALAPLRYATREQLLEVPQGTATRRVAGGEGAMLPSELRLTLGVQDVLLLRNSDSVPQTFGPVRLMPGQEFRLPFEQGGEYQLASTAHAKGQMTVSVVAMPDPGSERLRWRLAALIHAIRYLKLQAPSEG